MRPNNLNPLQILRRNAEAIASGDYSDRISVPQNDEIGMVADSFNRMAEAVETHITMCSFGTLFQKNKIIQTPLKSKFLIQKTKCKNV